MVVLRFTEEQDKELMREVIMKKPYATKWGETMAAWDEIASRLSLVISTTVNAKQVRDRLGILKKKFKTEEDRSARGSGVEEALDACNAQSHYSDLLGLIREYILLEEDYLDRKRKAVRKKKAIEESFNQCAADILAESSRRRSLRATSDEDCASDSSLSGDSDASSSAPASSQKKKCSESSSEDAAFGRSVSPATARDTRKAAQRAVGV